jgi:hypothetical protein
MTRRVHVEPSARKTIGRVKRVLLSARPPASVRGRLISSPSHQPRREQTMRWPARAWARGALTALVLVERRELTVTQQFRRVHSMKFRHLALLAAGLTFLTALPALPAAAQVPPDAPTGPTATAVKRSDGAVFVLIDGKRYQIGALTMGDGDLNLLPESTPYADGNLPIGTSMSTAQRSDGTIYVLVAGQRHQFTPIAMDDDSINALPDGGPYVEGILPAGWTPPVAAPAGAAPAAAPSDTAPQTSPLGDLSTFRAITQDTLDKLNASDQRGATTRIRDLETAWDNAEARLKPLSPAEWTKIDDKIDAALRQLRAVNPNPGTEKTALQELLDVLK